jgi:hypothetical protein
VRNVYQIPLKRGEFAIVDKADEELVRGFNWNLAPNGYVYADRSRMRIALHRLIAGPADHELVDHVNGNRLDNRTANLRIANSAQNGANRGPARLKSGKTSRFKGVSWSKTKQRWVVYVHHMGKTRYVGRFTDEPEAAKAYNEAAIEVWGEFARLNDV